MMHNFHRNLGPDRPDAPIKVTFRVTRPRPINDAAYYTRIYESMDGAMRETGPRRNTASAAYVFLCPSCVAMVPHEKITCLMPVGFGGQLEWTVDVLDRVSTPFRYCTSCGVVHCYYI
jgi:hypothetical protein